MISQYLKELIISQRRLIIPNLGAFLAKEDKDGQKNIIFSSFLKYNDGFLEKALSEKERISLPQATEVITKFVQQVTADIDANGKSIIDKFGYFSKDDRGGVQFTIDENATAGSKNAVVEQLPDPVPVPVEGQEESKIEKVLEEAAEEIAGTPLMVEKEEPKQTEEKKEEVVEEKKPEAEPEPDVIIPSPIPTPIPEPIVIPPTPITPTPPPVTNTYSWQTETTTVPPVVPPVVEEETVENNYYYEERKSRAWIWWLIILLLLLLGLGWYFFLGGKDCSIFTGKKAGDADSVALVDSSANNNDASAAANAVINYEFKYYVIVGCFVDLQNAQRLTADLKKAGYDNVEILPFQLRGLYPVCVAKTNDDSEALFMKDRRASEEGEVWIFDTTVPYGRPGIGGQ